MIRYEMGTTIDEGVIFLNLKGNNDWKLQFY